MRARARIDLGNALDGGLLEPMPSPCRSLILRVEHEVPEDGEPNLGVQITTTAGEAMSPGSSDVDVELDFWSGVADMFVVTGTRFTLRYPIRVVGHGQVLAVLTI